MSKRVMVVDDNEINGLMVSNMLEHYGVESDFFLSGEEAVEAAAGAEYALVLMDYLMPGIDGVEATKRLKALEGFEDVPVIALSGDTDNEIRLKFIDAGADGMIGKPVSTEDITRILIEYGISDEETIRRKTDEAGVTEGEISEEADESGRGNMSVTLKSLLDGIDGLDYDLGLKNSVGSEKNYFYVIKAGIKNITNCRELMGQYLSSLGNPDARAHADAMKQLRLALHSLKSIFLNIGVEHSSAEASKYEKCVKALYNEEADSYGSLKEEDNEHIKALHDDSGRLLEKLDKAAATYDEVLKSRLLASSEETRMDAEEFGALVEKAIADTKLFDIDSIIADIEKLAAAATSAKEKELLTEAMDATGSFKYDLILENLLKMGRGEAR